VAVLTALFAAMLSIGLGLSIVLLGSAETTLAAHDRDARALAYASRAAGAMAVSELRSLASLADAGAAGATPEVSATPGTLFEATLTPAAPWGGATLDLRALTAAVQAEADAGMPSGAPRPVWRLFIHGSLARAAPDAQGGLPCYLAVWVADDAGVLLIRAAAYGSAESRALTEMSLAREPGPGGAEAVRVLAVRPDP
jgi:hypothetical protein